MAGLARSSRTLVAAIGVAALAPVGPAVARAQAAATPVAGQRITFNDAIAIALRQNVDVRRSENAVAATGAVVSGRKSALLPSLSLNTSSAQSLGTTGIGSGGAGQSVRSLNAGLSSSLVLFDGLRNITELRQARLDETASTSDLTRTKQTAVYTVASNFLALTTAEGQLAVRRQNVVVQQAQESQLKKLVDAGARPISDLYQQQATTEAARAEVLTGEHDVELGKLALIQTLQLDPQGQYDFASPAVPDASRAASSYQLDSLLSRALASRADLAAEQTRVESAVQGTKAAGASRLPTVALSVGYNATYNSALATALGSQLNQNRGGSVSIGVSIPIFDRGATSAAVQQARIQEDDARLALAKQRQAVALDVRRAYLDYESTRQQLTVALAQQKAADLAVSTTQQRYQVGASTLLELSQARASQLQAATAVVSARNTLAFQDALMSYYTGELDPSRPLFGD